MKMKTKPMRIAALFLAVLLLLCGCGKTAQPAETAANNGTTAQAPNTEALETAPASANMSDSEPAQSTDAEAPAQNTDPAAPETEPAPETHSDTLVVVFSATGTTKGVAEKLASITGADLYEIIPAEPYSSADLNYNDSSSRSTKEQNDRRARPAIGSEAIDLSGYTTIFLGFPIWWGEEPRILDTFVESYDFTGKTVIPFCTSASSGIGRSGSNMESLAGSGTWLDGKRFSGGVSEDELRSWIEGLN